MQPSCTVFHSARSRKHGRRHVKPTHIPWSGRLHFARCFLVSMIDRRPDPRRIQQLHVDGMAPDNRARKDHARATTRRVCTSSVGRNTLRAAAAAVQHNARAWRARARRAARNAANRLCERYNFAFYRPGHTRETRGTRAHGSQILVGGRSLEVQKQVAQEQANFTSCDLGLPVHLGRFSTGPSSCLLATGPVVESCREAR